MNDIKRTMGRRLIRNLVVGDVIIGCRTQHGHLYAAEPYSDIDIPMELLFIIAVKTVPYDPSYATFVVLVNDEIAEICEDLDMLILTLPKT